MHVGGTILAAGSEAVIDENWCLLDNQSRLNTFINRKYLSNIRDDTEEKFLRDHFNPVLIYTNMIGDLTGYSNTVWYNTKGIANILSLVSVHNHHRMTDNSQHGNEFYVHISQRPAFKMTNYGLFCHNMRHLIKSENNAHIMVNNSRYLIPQVEENKKQ